MLLLKGDKTGAEVIKRLHNWHKAVDGRGLSENARSAYCEAMKFWLLDEWIPWHRQNPDYSLLDVNRQVFFFLLKVFMYSVCLLSNIRV